MAWPCSILSAGAAPHSAKALLAGVALLASAGLQPLDEGPHRDLEHRVGQAIVRDVVVARLPAATV